MASETERSPLTRKPQDEETEERERSVCIPSSDRIHVLLEHEVDDTEETQKANYFQLRLPNNSGAQHAGENDLIGLIVP